MYPFQRHRLSYTDNKPLTTTAEVIDLSPDDTKSLTLVRPVFIPVVNELTGFLSLQLAFSYWRVNFRFCEILLLSPKFIFLSYQGIFHQILVLGNRDFFSVFEKVWKKGKTHDMLFETSRFLGTPRLTTSTRTPVYLALNVSSLTSTLLSISYDHLSIACTL